VKTSRAALHVLALEAMKRDAVNGSLRIARARRDS